MKLFLSILIALILSVMPFGNPQNRPEEELKLSAILISDTHIKENDPISESVFEKGLRKISESERKDAIVIAGDITELGRTKEIDTFFDILANNKPCDDIILATGNHDTIRSEDYTADEAQKYILSNYDRITQSEGTESYYTRNVNGYKFIVLSDERSVDNIPVEISDEQLAFLDNELNESSDNSLPTFVVCHYPVIGVNGQEDTDLVVFDEDGTQKLCSILEKYKNVFMITGHLHSGINGGIGEKIRGFSHVETINGVTYVNLPAFGYLNIYGLPGTGNGFVMEVYDNEVVFRAKSFVSDRWYAFSEFSVPLI